MKKLMKWGSYGLLLILMGCGGSEQKESKEVQYNSILSDPGFQQCFKKENILVLAPASGVELEKIQVLQSLSFMHLHFPEGFLNNNVVPFHANSDAERFNFLKQALEDNSKDKIMWVLRGGYGSARLIEALEQLPKPKAEKWLVGYSDITALHLFLSQRWNWKTVYGSTLVELLNPTKDPKNFEKLAELLSSSVSHLEINQLQPLNEKAKQIESVEGRLTGGNLTLVQSSLGTGWQIQTAGKILFLEEVGEKGYRLDRTLLQLKQAGVFRNVKAIVLGDFSNGDEFTLFALQRFASETSIPVFKTDEFGHGYKNYPLIYNAYSTITPADESQLFRLKMRVKD